MIRNPRLQKLQVKKKKNRIAFSAVSNWIVALPE
jgi:hypothetical protein